MSDAKQRFAKCVVRLFSWPAGVLLKSMAFAWNALGWVLDGLGTVWTVSSVSAQSNICGPLPAKGRLLGQGSCSLAMEYFEGLALAFHPLPSEVGVMLTVIATESKGFPL